MNNGTRSEIRNYTRKFLMPGFDLCTRRRVKLQRHWLKGQRSFLDAGSGNGWFSYLAHRSGATVTAISATADEIGKARSFYNGWMGIPEQELGFHHLNFYELHSLPRKFDEIICYEALEHVKQDRRVAQSFFEMLNPGGLLHLCCPNAEHPRWKEEVLDLEERGGHVRAGYTLNSYRELLEPIGFEITAVEGVGGPLLTRAELTLAKLRRRYGDLATLPLAIPSFAAVWFDGRSSADCPFSIYVRAVRPTELSSHALELSPHLKRQSLFVQANP
jgi:SAM-dependent methyltransferase